MIPLFCKTSLRHSWGDWVVRDEGTANVTVTDIPTGREMKAGSYPVITQTRKCTLCGFTQYHVQRLSK